MKVLRTMVSKYTLVLNFIVSTNFAMNIPFVYDKYFLYIVLRIPKNFYPEQEPNLSLATKKQVQVNQSYQLNCSFILRNDMSGKSSAARSRCHAFLARKTGS